MVTALGTPKRHPESGIYLFRKRVPERLKGSVGKSEIKFSLRTRDPAIARIRHLEELAKIERAWSGIDAAIIDGEGRVLAALQCKSASDAGPAGTIAAGAVSSPTDPSADRSLAGSTAVAASDRAPAPLRPLFKSYGKEAQLSPATVKRWSPVVDRLVGHLGHDDAAKIARTDIVAWKDALLEGGMKNITVRDVYLAATKALLQFGVDQGLLAENPAKEVKVRVKKKVKEREKGFDGTEAAKILAATEGPFSHLISAEMAAARQWVPWIGAYTGARVNEITPLAGNDFINRDGIFRT